MTHHTINLNEQISWIKSFVDKVDATTSDWEQYNIIAKNIGECFSKQIISTEEKNRLKEAYGSAMTSQTLQGFVLTKPHGYAGDYEIIDKFYTMHTSPDERLAKWDDYLHTFPAVKAVRNRKHYIKTLLQQKLAENNNNSTFEMLNLASGPARDLYEFFNENPTANFSAECIDLDENAIKYATRLLSEHSCKVKFHNKNILRFKNEKQYDLVWSAGLFDYFNDEIFKRLIARFLNNVKPGGELVVGNFCSTNPDINYMVLLDWVLYHRNEDDLIRLVMECNVLRDNIIVEKEEEGVNLFIRIRK